MERMARMEKRCLRCGLIFTHVMDGELCRTLPEVSTWKNRNVIDGESWQAPAAIAR